MKEEMKSKLETLIKESTVVALPGNQDQLGTIRFLCDKAEIPWEPVRMRGENNPPSSQFFWNARLALLGISRRPAEVAAAVEDPRANAMAGITGSDMLIESRAGKLDLFDPGKPGKYRATDIKFSQGELPSPPYWWVGDLPVDQGKLKNGEFVSLLRRKPTVTLMERDLGKAQGDFIEKLRLLLQDPDFDPIVVAAFPVLTKQWLEQLIGVEILPGKILCVDGKGESTWGLYTDDGEAPYTADIVSTGASMLDNGLRPITEIFQAGLWFIQASDELRRRKSSAKPEDVQRLADFQGILGQWCANIAQELLSDWSSGSFRRSFYPGYSLPQNNRNNKRT
ncbi:MAG: hypothetical protein COY80_03085 [Candidatus Pacebacteria bacterium CG_4_10_14_0_8_um_filter_42_14]|nr:MAG: hypothetical protein COY80_03085 [Candidatus Pacebacteria bacterium CG_4_10_14_0_8_um_filter_42_14]